MFEVYLIFYYLSFIQLFWHSNIWYSGLKNNCNAKAFLLWAYGIVAWISASRTKIGVRILNNNTVIPINRYGQGMAAN